MRQGRGSDSARMRLQPRHSGSGAPAGAPGQTASNSERGPVGDGPDDYLFFLAGAFLAGAFLVGAFFTGLAAFFRAGLAAFFSAAFLIAFLIGFLTAFLAPFPAAALTAF